MKRIYIILISLSMAVTFSLLNTTVLADSPTEVKVDKVIEHGVDKYVIESYQIYNDLPVSYKDDTRSHTKYARYLVLTIEWTPGVDQEKMLLVLENGASWSENINDSPRMEQTALNKLHLTVLGKTGEKKFKKGKVYRMRMGYVIRPNSGVKYLVHDGKKMKRFVLLKPKTKDGILVNK